MKKVVGLCLIIFLTLLASLVYADVIHLRDGGTVEGKIIEETKDIVKVKTTYGIISFQKDQIASIEKRVTDEEIYKKKASKIKPNDPEAHHQLGLFCIKKGLNNHAIEEFKETLRLKSKHIDACYYLGIAYERKGKHKKALKKFKEVLKQNPFYSARDKDRLFNLLKKAKESKNYSEVHSYLGDAYERQGEYEEALAEWERVIDTCFESTEEERERARRHLRILHKRIPPNKDPAKANVWDMFVAIFRKTDFTWVDKKGIVKHVAVSLTDEQIDTIRSSMMDFAKWVFEHSRGQMRISLKFKVIDEPISKISTYRGKYMLKPEDVKNSITNLYKWGKTDTLAIFWNSGDIPLARGGYCFSHGSARKNASVFLCAMLPKFDVTSRTFNVARHEWLHNLDSAITNVLKYKKELFPDIERPAASYKEYSKDVFYEDMMKTWVTSKMWQEATIIDVITAPFIRDWLVCGPFDNSKKNGLATDYIHEEYMKPSLGKASNGKRWKELKSSKDYINLRRSFKPNNYVVAYVHTYIYSPKEQRARLWIGNDDGVKVWLNGRLIRESPAPGGARPWEELVPITLEKGCNRLLMKVDQLEKGWGFYAQICDNRSKEIKGLKYQLNQPQEIK